MESDRGALDESLHGTLTKSTSAASVALDAVSRSFEQRLALLPITLKIQPGEFISLLGPSGSGKSTLLRMIAGLDQSTSGQVNVAAAGPLTKSFVFQDAALLPWRTVLANVMLPFELTREGDQAEARAREALAQVGLTDALALYPNQLSGGMRMRVSVARAIVSRPSLMLLDEPFAALDERTRFRLQEDLRALWLKLRMTTIFVTHSVSEAVFVSDRAILFSSAPGRVVLDHAISLGEERKAALRTSVEYLREIETVTKAFES